MKKELLAARTEAERLFLPFDGVLGVGVGPKLRRGEVVAHEAVIVFVERKLPATRVRSGEMVPATIQGYPTDVRQPVLSSSLEGNQECAGDEQWLDWGKIHDLNLAQHAARRSPPRGRRTQRDNPADLPTTETHGDLFVIKDPSKTLVTTVAGGQVIDVIGAWNLFRASFGDDYDFVTFYIDDASGLPGDGNYSTDIFRSETGIGAPTANVRSTWGSSRLLRRCNHVWFTLRTLLHEPGHQWLAYVDYRDSTMGATQTLLHQDFPWGAAQAGFHWGRWVSDVKSCMDYDRHEWVATGSGTYNWVDHNPDEANAATATWFEYWDLDQYLMGLIPASQVSTAAIINNPSPALNGGTGPYTPGSVVSVSVAKIQYEEGARSPDYLNSQRVFHQAHVAITADNSATPTFIAPSQTWVAESTKNFRRATAGRALIDSSLLRANHADIYLRDNDSDTGTGPSVGQFWLSPDVWVRNTDDNGTDHQCPVRGQDNWVYVRVHNRGTQPYANVTASAYLGNFLSLTPGTEFLYPVDWNPAGRIGSATVASVPAASGGSDGTAIVKILWPASQIPATAGWHPCLLAEIIPASLAPAGLHHVWEDPRLAQRNVTIIDPASGCPPMSDVETGDIQALMFVSAVQIGHVLRVDEHTELRIDATGASPDVRLFLDPGRLVEGLSQDESTEIVHVDVPIRAGVLPTGRASVQAVPMPRFEHNRAPLEKRLAPLEGLTLILPEETEIGIAGDDISQVLRIRFLSETRIEVGYTRRQALNRRYGLTGLQPVILNGRPLLAVTSRRKACLRLPLKAATTETVHLIGVVSPYRGTGERVRYNITEVRNGRTIGGTSIELGL